MSDSVVAPLDPTPAYASPLFEKTLPRPAPTIAYSWTEYNPQAQVIYIRSHQQANIELAKLGSGPQVLGFDLEWKPTFVTGGRENRVALVQLANADTIFILQITAMQEFPEKLKDVLANPLIVKAGVGIQDDAKKLYNDWHVSTYNCVDLSLLARTTDNARWRGKYNHSLGLARLLESYEYRLMVKGRTTRSNWEAELNSTQLEYASNDAHAGYILFRKLLSMIDLQDPPETVWYSFNMDFGQLLTSEGYQWDPINPNYDPGPLPPPRPPREPRDNVAARESQNTSQTISQPATWKNNNDRKNDGRKLTTSNPHGVSNSVQTQQASGSGSNQFRTGRRYERRSNNPSDNRGPYPSPNLPARNSQAGQIDTLLTDPITPAQFSATSHGFLPPGPSRNRNNNQQTRGGHSSRGNQPNRRHRHPSRQDESKS